MTVVAWLVLGVLLAAVFGLLVVLGRAHEKFCVSVRSGRALLVRGRLPADALAALASLVGPSVDGSVLVKGYDREDDLVVEVAGATDAVALRIRMRLAELTPEALDRAPVPETTWWRVLGFVELAWWADSRLDDGVSSPVPDRQGRTLAKVIPFPKPSYAAPDAGSRVRLVILDLGGVVFLHSFDRALEVWAHHAGVDPRTLKGRYHHDEAYARHEVGDLDLAGYHRHVSDTLGLSLTLEQFVEGWNAIFLDEVPGIEAVLEELSQRVTLVALSNTNPTHCAFMRQRYARVLDQFAKVYYSHEIGARKPEAASYQKVLDDWGVEASQALFADDLEVNVAGARAVGLDAVQVTDASALVAGLVDRGLLLRRTPL